MLCSLNWRRGCWIIVNFHLRVHLLVILKRDQQNTVDILVLINFICSKKSSLNHQVDVKTYFILLPCVLSVVSQFEKKCKWNLVWQRLVANQKVTNAVINVKVRKKYQGLPVQQIRYSLIFSILVVWYIHHWWLFAHHSEEKKIIL